ncbi:hypothetical protein TNCV_1169131 [Trichonephila clavipes]|uniref:Uncharacterized protein n=1 Tax=Trichonephila clavipes TaxID=2585209 RepID=A0A8X6VPJ8_TRICX|nr:hypothetical protein TNCV_1169131 [Trichonephila clavipes]
MRLEKGTCGGVNSWSRQDIRACELLTNGHTITRPVHLVLPLEVDQFVKPQVSREFGGKGKEAGGPDFLQGVLPQNLDGTKPKHTAAFIVLPSDLVTWNHD